MVPNCVLAIVILFTLVQGDDTGTFWQLTDLHFDPEYNVHGDPANHCHGNTTQQPGYYGNYKCDSSWNLIESTIMEMKAVQSKPDFIIWTGDTVPHLEESSVDRVYSIIKNVTTALQNAFPKTLIFPMLGNHDAFPSNQMPLADDDNGYYSDILKKGGWSSLITNAEQQEQFKLGGYYAQSLDHDIKLIVLNTNMLYSLNKLVSRHPDPNDQLQWLRKQLADAREHKQKVYIAAHICPGSFERLKGMSWFYPKMSKHYLQIIEEFSEDIVAHFCGHEHTDSFRLMSHKSGIMFLSPAITPWESPLPGVGANNPGVRLYHYSYTSGQIMDYVQYYFNLTRANQNPGKATWQVEYQATTAYNISDCSAESFQNLTSAFTENSSIFKQYLGYNTVLYDTDSTCEGVCYYSQICAIRYLDIDEYENCIHFKGSTPRPETSTHHHRPHHKPHPVPRYMYYVIGGMGLLIVILAVVVSCLCFHRRQRGIPFRYTRIVGPIN